MADEQNSNDPYAAYGQGSAGAYGYGQGDSQGQAPDYGSQAPDYGSGQQYGETQQYGDAQQSGAPSSDAYGQQYGQSPAFAPGDPSGYGAAPYEGGFGAASAPAAAPAKFNIWGLIALIAGALGVISAILILPLNNPALSIPAFILGFVGLVMGILGLALKGFNARKGMAIGGLVLSVIAGILSIVMPIVWTANAIGQTVDTYSTYTSGSGSGSGSSTSGSGSGSSTTGASAGGDFSTSEPVNLEVVVTSTTNKPVDVYISINTDGADYSNSINGTASPYSYTSNTKLGKYYTVSVIGNASDFRDDVTCQIKINGVVQVENTTSVASCTL